MPRPRVPREHRQDLPFIGLDGLEMVEHRSADVPIQATLDESAQLRPLNGIQLDRHAEEKTVELFAANLMQAGEAYLDNPMDIPFIPCWSRVSSAIPDFLERLHQAVEEDNAR